MNVLALFDIDGNLVNVYKHQTPAYAKAIYEVYGVNFSFQELERNYGLPSREVISIPLREKGIEESVIQQGIERTLVLYSKELERRIRKDDTDVALPGVRNLLNALHGKNVAKGIVTGNIRLAGQVIIREAKIDPYFDPRIFSCGDIFTSKIEIVRDAIRKAESVGLYGTETKVFVFGDTPSDIEAAKANNCISVAVIKNSNEIDSSLGGPVFESRRKILLESMPDYLLNDYSNTDEVLSILGV